MIASKNADVIVIGGGPAGSTCATLLAQHGRSVILLEKDEFPRHHVGESLMTETYWVFERLGLLEKLKDSEFVRKYSVQFFGKSGNASRPYYFDESNDHESAVTWQLTRSEFDSMMIDNAIDHGVDTRHGATVTDIILDGERVTGVNVVQNGTEETLSANVVVDASGLNALISRKLNLQKYDPNLKKAAIYTYFKDAKRGVGKDEGATLIINTPDEEGWFWFIPLKDNVVSVGTVGNKSLLFPKGESRDLKEAFFRIVEQCGPIQERICHAEHTGEMHSCSDFSYTSDRIAGDGYVLIGDAFGFIDPVYSSGVFLALRSGELAADTINDAISEGDVSGKSLSRFADQYVPGVNALRNLVYCFYDKNFRFSSFLKDHPEFQQHLVDLLTGNVYRDGIHDIFEAIKGEVELPDPYKVDTT